MNIVYGTSADTFIAAAASSAMVKRLDVRAVELAAASVADFVRARGAEIVPEAMQGAPTGAMKRAIRRKERKLRREMTAAAMADAEVPLWIRALIWIVPKLLPPPWGAIVSAILFVVQFAIDHFAEQPESFVALCAPALDRQ